MVKLQAAKTVSATICTTTSKSSPQSQTGLPITTNLKSTVKNIPTFSTNLPAPPSEQVLHLQAIWAKVKNLGGLSQLVILTISILKSVHGSLARAGKVKSQTPKVEAQEKKKTPKGRAKKRIIYNRR
jgi:small subunit ribosomal protein S30e